jgi:hypothetical protein
VLTDAATGLQTIYCDALTFMHTNIRNIVSQLRSLLGYRIDGDSLSLTQRTICVHGTRIGLQEFWTRIYFVSNILLSDILSQCVPNFSCAVY